MTTGERSPLNPITAATMLATAALGPAGPDRDLVAALVTEIPAGDLAEVVTLAIAVASTGLVTRQGVALCLAASQASQAAP